jgi:hypothetical protein
MMIGIAGMGLVNLKFVFYFLNTFLADAAMLRAVGRCAAHKLG